MNEFLQILLCLLVGWPLVKVAPVLEGDARGKIDKIEDDREEALMWLALMEHPNGGN